MRRLNLYLNLLYKYDAYIDSLNNIVFYYAMVVIVGVPHFRPLPVNSSLFFDEDSYSNRF